MRLFRVSLCGVFLCAARLHAQTNQQDDSDAKQQAPEEIPDFSQLDEYTYIPKSTLSIGDRLFLRGPKTTFSGQGSIPSVAYAGSATAANIQRLYNDGYVLPDGRTIVVTDGVGSGTSAPAASDGRTNTWSYQNNNQLLPNGDIAFHAYAGEITDTSSHEQTGTSTSGIELIMDRDMGKIGKHLKWSITAGLSLADIRSNIFASVPGTLTTVADTYDLFGQVPPPAVYSSPSTIGSATGAAVDTQILIGNTPLNRTTTTSQTVVTNRYFTQGAYYTFRVGPTFTLPMGKHWNFNVSAGPAIIFAGSEINVLEDLVVATNEPDLEDLYQKENNKMIPGFYVDADLQYQLTETSGFYVGAVYQDAGSFNQSISSGAGTAYDSKIDFGSQEGVKTGMTVRF